MARQRQDKRVEQQIAEARRQKATQLDLSFNELTALPESLGQLTQLQQLDLYDNQLTALPESLGQLAQLQQLTLYDNRLTALPESLGQLTQLQQLDLSGNPLTALPESLGQLTQLKGLYLQDNQLTALPESLGQLTQLQVLDLRGNRLTALPESLGQLTQLKGLYLQDNQLTALPEFLGQLTQLRSLDLDGNQLTALPESLDQLTQLQRLDLSDNRLTALPESLGQLTQLQRLDLSDNRLTALPESLGQLTQLQQLDLSGNPLTALPEFLGQLTQLQSLDLSNNRLTVLPESLRRCQRLEVLFLHGNEALGIPPEILGPEWHETKPSGNKDPADPQAILEWYFQSQAEPARRLNEAKMLLVGQGGVGKTSLVHYLIHNKRCKPDELPTEGINIDDWHVQGKKGDASHWQRLREKALTLGRARLQGERAAGAFERINLHIWDFGGQEIMHATHQFFLTRRSLYLLVIDARAGEKESNIHYWLKIIQSYGGDSPVLVVVNKCDQHPHELNETRLVRDYPNIQGFVQTSCASGQGIGELRREIGKQVRRLPHVFDELPQSYFAVKEELERTAHQKNYLPIEEYRAICRHHKVDEPASQDRLIRFLHDLGVVLNFQDPEDPFGQDDQFVLDPEWVTEGVYTIINDHELKQRKNGLLSLAERRRILSNAKPLNRRIVKKAKAGDCFPAERHGFIMDKMCQFELAYEFDRQGDQHAWLIPELLDPKEPTDLDWQPEASLNFQYAYPVLPAGVICRFIVRMHKHVDRSRSWRSGTLLNIDGNRVLVRGDTEKNRVFIAVQGAIKQRKESLAIVREAFRYIHSTIPALKPAEQVPLPDNPEIAEPYDYLLKLVELGERSFVPRGAGKRYVVTELLNGVDSTPHQRERRKRIQKGRQEMGEKHLFVSYCRDNKEDVARLVEALENAGEPVWWDDQILGGRDWKEKIREAMKNAYAVVLCLSPELTEARYRSGVYPEIRDAITIFRQYGPGHTFLFPVRLAECEVPPIEIDDTRTLERIQHIDLFPENRRSAGLQRLLESLATAPEHP